MKILFLDAYFSPEKIAFTHLEQDLIQGILNAGHEIEVLCPVPTRGITEDVANIYARKKEEILFDGCVHIRRFWAPREGSNPVGRALRYFWCNMRQYWLGKRYKNIGLIFAVSTPPTQGFLAGKLAKKLNCRVIYNLQDIFPDSLVTTGLTKEGSILWRIGRKIEDITYQFADSIVVISQAMKRNIMTKGVPEDKIRVISNWINTEAVKPIRKEENRLFEAFGIDREKFTVVYAGNFGEAQGAEIILEAAERLSDIQFVIFGGGSGYECARERAERLPNVIINSLLSQEWVSEVYSLGDVALITCKKGVGASGMPSKTWSIMACNTPIIASFDTDSELARIITSENVGVCVEPGNVDMLVQAIVLFRIDRGRFNNGREYVCNYASREKCVSQYIKILNDGML